MSRKLAATLVLQLRDQGGLNQITSLFLFLFLLPVLLLLLVGFGSNFILKEYPDFSRAFWKGGADSSKIFSFADIFDNLLLTDAGIFFYILPEMHFKVNLFFPL